MDIYLFSRIPNGLKLVNKVEYSDLEEINIDWPESKVEWADFGQWGLYRVKYKGNWYYAVRECVDKARDLEIKGIVNESRN